MDVSIIIVNYNTKQMLKDCLASVYQKTKGITFEVLVSDNGSKDGSVEMISAEFPQVICIENNENLGFGAANNRALKKATGKYIFYLNSDTILLNNAAKLFFDYWECCREKETLGALGANLLNAEHKFIHSYGEFPSYRKELHNMIHAVYGTNKIYFLHTYFGYEFKPVSQDYFSEKTLGEVPYITGADLFLRNNESAFFDEQFFMYCEETDLQCTMSDAGLKMKLIDGPEIIHLFGGSNKKQLDEMHLLCSFSSLQYNLSLVYYFKKHGVSSFKIFALTFFTLLLWLNPFIFTFSKKYIGRLLHI